MSAKITLINPDSPFLLDAKVMPNLGLLYIAASLKQRGVEYDFVDLARGSCTSFGATPFYGITATTPQFNNAKKLLRLIRNGNPEGNVCIGGPHATLCPEQCLAAGFDAVVVGEGEYAIFDFLRGQQGIIRAHEIKNLDELPFPDRSLVKEYDYRVAGKRTATLIASRGCMFNCAFCSKNWKGIRFRSWSNIVEEIQEISELGYEGVQFEDDALWYNPKRDRLVFEALHSFGLVWRGPIRADYVTVERAEFMKSRGCWEVFIGVESFSDRILKTIDKKITAEQMERAIRIFYDVGIQVKIGLVLGLPGDNEASIRKTWKACNKLEYLIADFGITTLMPYPGSRIYNHPERFDIRFDRNDVFEPHTGGRCVVATSALTREEIAEWRRKFYMRFKGRDYK